MDPGAAATDTGTDQPMTDDSGTITRDEAMAMIGDMIFFDFDRSELRPEARTTLQQKSEILRQYPDIRVRIEGNADERGTVEYNLALGERRADAARTYLIDLGIDPDRLTTISYGEERPLDEGHNEAAWQQNRRDEFIPIP
jgi:peptidoglycan-associated lipoprotein